MSDSPVLITMGDPAGIGPEIVTQAFARLKQPGAVVVGDIGTMQIAAHRLHEQGHPKVQVQPVFNLDDDATGNNFFSNRVSTTPVMPVLQVMPELPFIALGQVSPQAGRASAIAVEWATEAVLKGRARALVTAPIHKQAWHAAGISFPGHTEMLQALCAQHIGCDVRQMPVRMMLACPRLKVVLVTIHMALRDVVATLDAEQVLETLRIAHRALKQDLGRAPRLALAGLNPHAGEGGRMGDEEIRILKPAIREAQAEGIQVSGPFPADTVFLQALDAHLHPDRFDAVVAMYHDQGLIPVKLLGFDEGVNVTLGLPLRRTSPDHGTAFDIAGTGCARPREFVGCGKAFGCLLADTIPQLIRS